MGKSAEVAVALLAVWRLGAVHVPLFTAVAPPAIAARITGNGTKIAVLRPGAAPSDELAGELKRIVKDHYAAHAYPPKIHFVSELPKAASGKIQRLLLRVQSGDAQHVLPDEKVTNV